MLAPTTLPVPWPAACGVGPRRLVARLENRQALPNDVHRDGLFLAHFLIADFPGRLVDSRSASFIAALSTVFRATLSGRLDCRCPQV